MSSERSGLSAQSLAEVALVLSRAARRARDQQPAVSDAQFKQFWQSGRLLEWRWTQALDQARGPAAIEECERLAARVFTTEMVVRVWSALVTGGRQNQARLDAARLARNVVSGLTRVRHSLLARTLDAPSADASRALAVDRLRRRCERWTDVLVGPLALEADCLEFAYDQDRAREFGEEQRGVNPAVGPHPAEHLVAAGLTLSFLSHLSEELIDEPELVTLIQSILSSLPDGALHRDGTLRTLLEERVKASQRLLERAPGPLSPLEEMTSARTHGIKVRIEPRTPGADQDGPPR